MRSVLECIQDTFSQLREIQTNEKLPASDQKNNEECFQHFEALLREAVEMALNQPDDDRRTIVVPLIVILLSTKGQALNGDFKLQWNMIREHFTPVDRMDEGGDSTTETEKHLQLALHLIGTSWDSEKKEPKVRESLDVLMEMMKSVNGLLGDRVRIVLFGRPDRLFRIKMNPYTLRDMKVFITFLMEGGRRVSNYDPLQMEEWKDLTKKHQDDNLKRSKDAKQRAKTYGMIKAELGPYLYDVPELVKQWNRKGWVLKMDYPIKKHLTKDEQQSLKRSDVTADILVKIIPELYKMYQRTLGIKNPEPYTIPVPKQDDIFWVGEEDNQGYLRITKRVYKNGRVTGVYAAWVDQNGEYLMNPGNSKERCYISEHYTVDEFTEKMPRDMKGYYLLVETKAYTSRMSRMSRKRHA